MFLILKMNMITSTKFHKIVDGFYIIRIIKIKIKLIKIYRIVFKKKKFREKLENH